MRLYDWNFFQRAQNKLHYTDYLNVICSIVFEYTFCKNHRNICIILDLWERQKLRNCFIPHRTHSTPLHSTSNEKAFKVKTFPSTRAFRSTIFSEKTAVISNKNRHYTGIAEDMGKIPSKPKCLPGFLPVVQWGQHPTGGEGHMFHSRRGLRFFSFVPRS